MTPQEAINHGKEQLEIFGGEHKEFIEMAIKALEQTMWIPVSERLPKKDETEVLITLKEDGSVLQATYLDDRTFDTEAYGWFAIKDISAWMLLPKPYEESEDEK